MIDRLTIEELTLIRMAMEQSLEDWVILERGLETVKMFFPDDCHILYTEDELPSEALDLAEMLLIKVNDELRLRGEAGETAWWREGEIITSSTKWRLVRRRN